MIMTCNIHSGIQIIVMKFNVIYEYDANVSMMLYQCIIEKKNKFFFLFEEINGTNHKLN